MAKPSTTPLLCPCGSGQTQAECCQPFLSGARQAPTAETLMRSRYTAYVCGNADYLLQTWHPQTRPATLDLGGSPAPHWLGLKIITTKDGAFGNHQGSVEFVARYKLNGKALRLHECSEFSYENGCWYYMHGQQRKILPKKPAKPL